MPMQIVPFNDAKDFATQRWLVELYGDEPFAEVLHQALTGVAGMWIYTAWVQDEVKLNTMSRSQLSRELVGAGILKSPEVVMPIGPAIQPIGWAISDMITKPTHRRQGIARALLRRLEGDAFRNGGRVLYLYTEKGNEPAIRLYESVGFGRMRDQSNQAVFVKLLEGPDGQNRR